MNLVAWIGRYSPALANRIRRWYVSYLVPFNRAAGIRVAEVDAERARFRVRLKNLRRNLNVAGTVHGGAILALAETIHGVAVLWTFAPDKHRMFTKTARIEYLAPGRGELSVEYCLNRDLRDRIERELADRARSEVTMESVVVDSQRREIARLMATYVVLRPGTGDG